MVTRRKAVLALGMLAALPACALRAAASEEGIRDVRQGRPLDEEGLLRVLRGARHRLLGEVHDNPAHHAIRARLLDALGRAGLRPAVAFEQFDAANQASLQEIQKGKRPTAEDVARAVGFDRKGWNWDFYRPIVEAALRHGMELRAAGLSQASARATQMPPWAPKYDETLKGLIFEGHCRALPESALPGMAAAQRARDRKMAEVLEAPSPDGTVLIAGNGHVRMDVGVPYYLPPEGLVAVGFLEEAPQGRVPFDFVWITQAAARPDPCEAFRRRK